MNLRTATQHVAETSFDTVPLRTLQFAHQISNLGASRGLLGAQTTDANEHRNLEECEANAGDGIPTVSELYHAL